jgi:ATP-dependent RNA helicase SUPV3L1/SUV3
VPAAPEVAAVSEELAASAGNASEGAEASDGAEPAFIEIWRPGRRDRPKPRRDRAPATARPAGDGQAASEPSASGQPADKQRPRSQRPRKRKFDGPRQPPPARKARVEKQADPDSPFAALAALKAQLEGKDEGR